jgi:hypothetical protein
MAANKGTAELVSASFTAVIILLPIRAYRGTTPGAGQRRVPLEPSVAVVPTPLGREFGNTAFSSYATAVIQQEIVFVVGLFLLDLLYHWASLVETVATVDDHGRGYGDGVQELVELAACIVVVPFFLLIEGRVDAKDEGKDPHQQFSRIGFHFSEQLTNYLTN